MSGLQRKLAIGASNDPLEREADQVANQVMATPTHSTINSALLRIQHYAGQATGQADMVPASVDRVLASSGRPLEPVLRQDMEQRFGQDFSRVRVHSGAAAEQSARDVSAHAYTVGHNVVFGTGGDQLYTDAGRQLLAHELAHVVQQSHGENAAGDTEARADIAENQFAQGRGMSSRALGGAPAVLQAKPADTAAVTDSSQSFPIRSLDGFALNSTALTTMHGNEIDKLAWSISLHLGMRRNGRATISVVGHTDRSGDEKLNQALGQDRADTAKKALIDALKKQGVGEDKFGEIASTTRGESSPAVPTADGVKNEKNRRVEISVSIGSEPVAVTTPSKPTFDPLAPLSPSVLQPAQPPIGPRRDQSSEDLWKRMEENRKKIEDFDRKHPAVNKGLRDAVIDKVMEEVVDPLINKLPVPMDLKDLARSGVRKGLEKGSEAACDAAVDATGATGKEAEGLKAACKALLQTKTGQ
jgi:outer membrane protein OmpA-like peptidoglycan-associated protein